MIIAFLVASLAVIADQVSKWAVVNNIPEGSSVTVIEGVLNWNHIRNDGMAFGMLGEHRWIFITLTVVLLLALVIFLFYYRNSANLWLKIACGLVLGGGIGNMIDRVALGEVIDFIDFCLFDFWKWIFNVADACVCVGVFMLAIYLIIDSIRCEREKKKALEEDDLSGEDE